MMFKDINIVDLKNGLELSGFIPLNSDWNLTKALQMFSIISSPPQ